MHYAVLENITREDGLFKERNVFKSVSLSCFAVELKLREPQLCNNIL